MNPKVSVIVVGHADYEKYLPTAVTSLKTQTTGDMEIVYVDNTGYNLSSGSNCGISNSRGKYIVRVDSDDWVEPELIEHEMAYLDLHPDIDCVWSDFIEAKEVHPGVFTLEVAEQTELTHACAAMYRKEVWEVLGGYDESLDYQESFDFWERFLRAGFKADRIALPLYYYRKHEGSMSTNPNRDAVRKQLMEKYGISAN